MYLIAADQAMLQEAGDDALAEDARAARIVVDVVIPVERPFGGMVAPEVVQQIDDREAGARAQRLDSPEGFLGSVESGRQGEAEAPAQRLRGRDLVRMRLYDHHERN